MKKVIQESQIKSKFHVGDDVVISNNECRYNTYKNMLIKWNIPTTKFNGVSSDIKNPIVFDNGSVARIIGVDVHAPSCDNILYILENDKGEKIIIDEIGVCSKEQYDSKKVLVGTNHTEVIISNTITADYNDIDPKVLQTLIDTLKKSPWVVTLNIGCTNNVTLGELNAILSQYNELNGK